jgi:hypothetical protein
VVLIKDCWVQGRETLPEGLASDGTLSRAPIRPPATRDRSTSALTHPHICPFVFADHSIHVHGTNKKLVRGHFPTLEGPASDFRGTNSRLKTFTTFVQRFTGPCFKICGRKDVRNWKGLSIKLLGWVSLSCPPPFLSPSVSLCLPLSPSVSICLRLSPSVSLALRWGAHHPGEPTEAREALLPPPPWV